MKIIHTTKKQNADYIENNNIKTKKEKDEISSFKDVGSSMPILEAQGRALINLSKISFKGIDDSCFEEYKNTDLSESTIKELLKLTPKQRKEALDLYQEGIIPNSRLIEVVKQDEEIKNKMLDVIRKGVNAECIIKNAGEIWNGDEFIKLDKDSLIKKYNEIIDFINNGADTDAIQLLLSEWQELSRENLQRISYFFNKMKSSPKVMMENLLNMDNLTDICQNDEKFQRAVSLFDMGITNFYTMNLASDTEDTYKKGIELFNSGFNEKDLTCLVEINDEILFKKIQELMQKYSISADIAKEILESKSNQTKAQKLFESGITPNIELLRLSDKLLEDVIQLKKEGYSEDEISGIMMSDIIGNENLENFIARNEKGNDRWNEYMQNAGYSVCGEEELSKQDINFLKTHAFESEFYNPNEYINKFLYLKNLKTLNGENILGCESFINKIKTNGLGDFAAKQENMMYKNIEALLSIDPASKEAGYIQTILDLIQIGKVNPSAFRKLSDLNDLKSLVSMLVDFDFDLKTKNESGWNISNDLINDINLIGNMDFDSKNYTDKYVPLYKDEKEGIKNSKIGDAFVLDGEKYIRMKTDEDKSETVKLTKETYAKLFPPVERFLTSQQIMGDCYCIETLMSLYQNNNTRINLLRTMMEDENGSITIKMGDYKPVTFEKGKLPENESAEIYSSGADGYKLFEYAYSCALVQDKIKEAQKNLMGDKLAEFNNFINSNPDDFFIYNDNGETKWSSYTQAVEEGLPTNFGVKSYKTFNNLLLGNGGLQNDVYDKLGYKTKNYVGGFALENLSKREIISGYEQQGIKIDDISTLYKAERLLKTPDYFKNHQVQIGLGRHAYNLTQETDNNGNTAYYLYNPHNQGFPIKFNCLDDLFPKITTITVIEMNDH